METSVNGYDLIKHYEGCYTDAYKCSADVWTIGYGHTQGVTEHQIITPQQADELLKEDVRKIEFDLKYLLNKEGIKVTQNQYDSLISFSFNVKGGVNTLKTSELFEHIKKQECYRVDVSDIPKELAFFKYFPEHFEPVPKEMHIITYKFLNWIGGGGQSLRGLYRRRLSESILYLENELHLF